MRIKAKAGQLQMKAGQGPPPPGMPPAQPGTTVVTTTTTTTTVADDGFKNYKPCCWPNSFVMVSECAAIVILILNIAFFNLGSLIGSCIDRRGCNCTTVCFAIVAPLLGPFGYIWCIWWGCDLIGMNKGRK